MQKETLEVIEMMVGLIIEMKEELKVLNEKQNQEGHNEVPKSGRTDGGKQIPFSGL